MSFSSKHSLQALLVSEARERHTRGNRLPEQEQTSRFRRVSAEEVEGSITILDRLALQLYCMVNTSATVTNSPLDVAAVLPVIDAYGAN